MSIAAYEYVSNSGITYQVVLPSDVATALSYTAATGTEPYLPNYISPRYVNYVSANSNLWLSRIVTSPVVFAQLPPQITIGSINYSLTQATGEGQNALPGGNLIVIAGPQGPPGQPLAGIITQGYLGSNVLCPGGTTTEVLSLTGLQAGTYIVQFDVTLYNSSGSALTLDVRASADLAGAVSVDATSCSISGGFFATASLTRTLAIAGPDDTVALQIAPAATVEAQAQSAESNPTATKYTLIQLL